MPLAGETELSAITKDPQTLIRIPVGAMSPLWGLFAGAAVTGAAWWWMTRWTRPANLEAMFAAEPAVDEVATQMKALAAPAVEAIEHAPAWAEAAVEETHDAMVQAADAMPPVAEAAMETMETMETGAALAAEAAHTAAEAGLATVETTAEAMTKIADTAAETVAVTANTMVEAAAPKPVVAAVDEMIADTVPALKPEPKLKKSKTPKAD